MEYFPQPHELQLRKADATSSSTRPVTFKHKSQVKDLSELHVDSEDDLQRSRPPSMTDGSSRTSSVSSMFDHLSEALSKSSFTQQHSYMNNCDRHIHWLPSGCENNVQRHRTESPSPLRQATVSRPVRDSTPPSTSHNDRQNDHACYDHPAPSTLEASLGELREDVQSTKGLPSKPVLPQSLAVTMSNSGIDDVKALSGNAVLDPQSTKSTSDSEDESDDDDYGDDDNWSGATYLETAIYQAVFPDVALAAYLISKMYSMLLLGSSKKISRKVSSWRERITTCAGTTVSGTTSTEKAAPTNASSSTLGAESSKRNRLGGSTDSNIGEEEDDGDDDDDSDGSRRKRLKESNLGKGFVIPTQRLACPFNKMDPSKYGIQHNQGGKNKYRACSGPGFLSISLLKEHLKRKHYPVQCERCYSIFKFKGTNRSPAVAELEKHRQLDEGCPKGQPTMKEGISEAQWTNLSEEKHCRKGKAVMTELPKSDVDKWKDIWRILFPDLLVPITPWYDTPSTDMTGSTPSQGLHPYLKVYEEILTYKLPTIKEVRSDSELTSLLLETARKSFEVWSATCRWNEALTSSLSNSRGSSDLLGSTQWEHIPKPTSSPQRSSPKASASSVFPNLTQSDDNSHPGTVGNFPTDQTSAIANLQELPESIPYSVGTITPGPQVTMPVSSGFEFIGTLGAEYPTFPQNGYSGYTTNAAGMGSNEWGLSQMEQMEAHANTFDMGIMPHQNTRIAPPPQWRNHYHPHHFGRFGNGP